MFFTIGKIIAIILLLMFGIYVVWAASGRLRAIDKDERFLQDYAKLIFAIFLALMVLTIAIKILTSIPSIGEFLIQWHYGEPDDGLVNDFV